MPYQQRIKLIFAVSLVIVTVVLFGGGVRPGHTAPTQPITRQIMRRKERSKLPASSAEITELRKKAQDKEKRNLITREFKDMPLQVHEIRNKDSDTWYRDLQIEVKNIGTKPIFFMLAYLDFPDHKSAGRDTGISLTFGDLKYVDINLLADSKDLHLDPGQSYVFTIPEKTAKGLAIQHQRRPEEFKKLDFHFGVISFGDRTGFEAGGDPVDLRNKKEPTLAD